jgi:hypothetical protein
METVNVRGAFAGRYKVTVSQVVYPPGTKPPATREEAMAQFKHRRQGVPARYTAAEQTPLRAEVPSGGTRDIVLNLEEKP